MAGDPAAPTYKLGTQHGANRLAAVGITALTVVPETRWGRIRPSVLGGSFGEMDFPSLGPSGGNLQHTQPFEPSYAASSV
jgi:hypothetical protein